MPLSHDPAAGTIHDDQVRYVLIRPDVLMGVARELDGVAPQRFLAALEASVFRHVQASLAGYQQNGRLEDRDALASIVPIAGSLGWGAWTVRRQPDGASIVEVRGSPFAAGFGASPAPVCTPIRAVLRALTLASTGTESAVIEQHCCAQGGEVCRFHVSPSHPVARPAPGAPA